MLHVQTLHPFWRIVLGIVGLGLLAFFLFFGLIVAAAFAGLALVGGVILSIRNWWLGRRLDREAEDESPTRSGGGADIEGEYVVIERRSYEERR